MTQATNLIAFPRPIIRGRKRVASYTHTSGGDLALAMMDRDGEEMPQNVVRLLSRRDHPAEGDLVAIAIACAVFTKLDESARQDIRKQFRSMQYYGAEHLRAVGSAAGDILRQHSPKRES